MTTAAPTIPDRVRPARGDAPVHVVPGPRGHGVDLCARQLAGAVGAPVAPALAATDRRPAHLHVTDRVWGDSPEQAAQRVVALCGERPTTLTLHDVPQPHDGPVFGRRTRAYAAMVRAARGVVVSSEHELRLLGTALGHDLRHRSPGLPPVAVVPLPLVPPTRGRGDGVPADGARGDEARGDGTRTARSPGATRSTGGRATLGLAGWFYPGKGHLPALGAAVAQRRRGHEVDVLVLGAPAAGHDADAAALVRRARRLGVRLEVTGWLSDDDLAAALRTVDVPFVGHRNVSASGSLNSWVVAGRRPLVRRGAYFEEMERLRPGTLRLVRTGDLAAAVGDALADPGSTWLDPGARLGHDLADAARAYRRFWGRVLGPHSDPLTDGTTGREGTPGPHPGGPASAG